MSDTPAARTRSLEQEQAARAAAETAQRRLGFIAEASARLAVSLDYQTTLASLARLIVPYLADYCVIDVLDDSGEPQRVATVHSDPSAEAILLEIQRCYPPRPDSSQPASVVLRTGTPIFIPDTDDAAVRRITEDDEHARLLHELGLKSLLSVALAARGRVLGDISFGITSSSHRYGADDLALAEEVARRAALAVDNARLYQLAQREIADRQHAEAVLQESEQRLQAILDGSTAIIYVKDPQGRFLTVNRRFEVLFGLDREAFMGKTDHDLFPSDVADPFREHDQIVLRERVPMEWEEVLVQDDGPHTYISNKFVLLDARGEPYAVCGISTDITERKRAEQAQRFLAEAGTLLGNSLDPVETLRSLARLAVPALADWCAVDVVQEDGFAKRVAVVHVDPSKERLAWELARLYPWDVNQSGRPVAEVIRTGQSQLVRNVSEQWLQSIVRDEHHLALLQGLGVNSVMSVPLPARGRTLGVITVVTVGARRFDTTDLALAEEVARRAALAVDNARLYREARESEHEARALYEAALAIGAELDLDSRLEQVLDSTLELLGVNRAEIALVDEAGEEVQIVAARGEQRSSIGLRMAVGEGLTGTVVATNRPLRVADMREDPRTQHLDSAEAAGLSGWLGVPLGDAGGAFGVLSVQSTRVDAFVEEDQRVLGSLAALAGAAVRESRLHQQIQQAIRARDEFVSSAAHDLKNPLTALKGLAQLLLRRATRSTSDEGRQFSEGLQRIDGITVRMGSLLQEMLDVTRIESGRPLELQRRTVDLVALARQVVAEQQRATTRLKIGVRSAETELVGEWDPLRLERVLGNLLSNATKYSPEGGDITVSLARDPAEGGWAVLQVRDTGIGIPAADLPHIFERFRRARNVQGRIAGTGIGLAGARLIVEQHGGRIDAESSEGSGSTFTVRLPLSDGQEAPQMDGTA